MKLFASDYDGTFLKHQPGGLDQLRQNKLKVLEWQDSGGLFGFSTGRVLPLILHQIEKHGLSYDFIVALNGALIVDQNLDPIQQSYIQPETALQLINILEAKGYCNYMISNGYTGSFVYTEELSDAMRQVLIELQAKGLFTQTVAETLKHPISQISVINLSPGESLSLAGELSTLMGEEILIYPNNRSIDFSPLNTSKSLGLKCIIEHFGVLDEQVVCIGDSWNDLEMIRDYQGFAMIESPDEIKSHASHIFETVEAALNWCLKH